MVRLATQNSEHRSDGTEAAKLHRIQRKHRGHKLAGVAGSIRREERSGWGYTKHRSVNSHA